MTARTIPRPGIATPYFKGNCRPCEACALQREAFGPPGFTHRFTQCQVCDGWGFVPLTDAEIVAATVAEAARLHRWPAPHPLSEVFDIGPDGPETAPQARRTVGGVRGRLFAINGLRTDLGLTGLTGRYLQGSACAREGRGNERAKGLLTCRSKSQALRARQAHFCR